MLSIVRAPSTAVVASVSTAEPTIATVSVRLVVASALMPKPSKPSVLAVLAALHLVQVAWIAAEPLLMGLRWEALSTLNRSVLGRGSWAAGLGSESRGARSAALRIAKGLQGVLSGTLLASLLLTV